MAQYVAKRNNTGAEVIVQILEKSNTDEVTVIELGGERAIWKTKAGTLHKVKSPTEQFAMTAAVEQLLAYIAWNSYWESALLHVKPNAYVFTEPLVDRVVELFGLNKQDVSRYIHKLADGKEKFDAEEEKKTSNDS